MLASAGVAAVVLGIALVCRQAQAHQAEVRQAEAQQAWATNQVNAPHEASVAQAQQPLSFDGSLQSFEQNKQLNLGNTQLVGDMLHTATDTSDVTDTSSSTDNSPATATGTVDPDQISEKIADEDMVVAPTLAATPEGEVKDLQTGATVTDPTLVGTEQTPPDPLAKTAGESFLPVTVADVRAGEVDGALIAGTDTQSTGDATANTSATGNTTSATNTSATNTSATLKQSLLSSQQPTASKRMLAQSAVYSPTPYRDKLQQAALENSEYGPYWGTYNNTPAFFDKTGKLFVQQAYGVIDVSAWQGRIDWDAVKASGVEGAIIRISYGYDNGYDTQALRNIQECQRLGIPFGIYMYSYAYDADFAEKEARDIVSLLRGAGVSPDDLGYPVYYDLERWTWTGHTPPTDPAVYDQIVNTWFEYLSSAGYTNLSVYSYTSYLKGPLNTNNIHSKTHWVAQYGSTLEYTEFYNNARMWQYTSSGKVSGIEGNVDLNVYGNLTFDDRGDVRGLPLVQIPDGIYYINSLLLDTKGVDIQNGSSHNGAPIQLYGANQTNAQKFRFTRQQDGSYTIVNIASGKALDVSGGIAKKNAIVQQWSFNNTAAQRWYIRDTPEGYYLQSVLGNWVLDVSGANTANETPIRLYQPNKTRAQKFSLATASQDIPTGEVLSIAATTSSGTRVNTLSPSTQVFDVSGASTNNGALLQLYAYNTTTAQHFVLTAVGNGVFTITNVNSGKVLDVAGGLIDAGTAIQQYSSNGTMAQHWSLIRQSDNTYSFINTKSGLALTLDDASMTAGTKMSITGYAANRTQRFSLLGKRERLEALAAAHQADLKDGTYTIATQLASNRVLDVSGGSLANAANIQIWVFNGTGAQQWRVNHDAKGYVTLTNVGSGKVLDVDNASTRLCTNVQQFSSNNTYAQKWIAVKQGNGSYTLYSALDENYVLDLDNANTASGTNIQMYRSNQTAAQFWKFQALTSR